MTTRAGMWIALVAQAEGSEQDGFRIAHYWDRLKFAYKSGAIDHGFQLGRSDDFNVALIGAGGLTEIWWMHKRIDEEPEVLARISREIGLVAGAPGGENHG